jgi:hypothetical protein
LQSAAAALFGLTLASTVEWSAKIQSTESATSATIPNICITLAASLGLIVLSHLEHKRTFRPSILIIAYLFFSILLDLPRSRTLWLRNNGAAIPAIFVTSMGVRLVMLVLESCEKRHALLAEHKAISHEKTRGLVSNILFTWLGPMFRAGYRRILYIGDTASFEPEMKTKTLHSKLSSKWATGM